MTDANAKTPGENPRPEARSSFFDRHLGLFITTLISAATITITLLQFYRDTRTAEWERQAAEKRANRNFDIEISRLVVSSIADKNDKMQIAMVSLISLVSDTGLSKGLLEAVKAGGTKVAQKEAQFAEESQPIVKPDSKSKSNWRIDVFYCESSEASGKSTASLVHKRIQSLSGFEARLRELPMTVNNRPGYQVKGYEVRYEAAEESEALTLRTDLNKNFNVSFDLQRVLNKTPQYISVFVCP